MIVPGSDCVRPETQSPDSRILPLLPCLVKSLCVAGPRGLTLSWLFFFLWTVYVLDLNQPSLPTFFLLFCSCVCFCLFGPFNCISFHKFFRDSPFSDCSSSLTSALLVLSAMYLFMKVSFSPDVIASGCLGSRHKITNQITDKVGRCGRSL